MEKLMDNILSFPSSRDLSEGELVKETHSHLSFLNRIPAATLASSGNGTDLLSILDPSVNSLAYLYVLVARLDLGPQNVFDVTWRQIVTFLESFDARHVRFAHDIFKRLVEGFITYASDAGKPLIAVRPLKKAILRYNPHRFSFMHSPFLRLCLEAKCYRDAVAICDIDLIEFPFVGKNGRESENDPRKDVAYQDVLSYFLYAGMVYMGVKEWKRAGDFLTYAIVAPGNVCSQIQVEAYKKFILVGLLIDGKPVSMPRATTVTAARAYRALTKPYDSFAQAFKSGAPDLIRAEVAQLVDVFRQDSNTGLAVQCLEAFRRVQIVALRETYVTLSTEEISKKDLEVTGRGGGTAGKEATESVILGMIERDEISASLSHSSPDLKVSQAVVHFHNNPVDESRTLSALQGELRRIMTLNRQMKAINKKYGLSKEYIQFALKLAKYSGGTSGLSGGDPDLMDYDYGSWADDEPEETIMQDFDM